MPALTHDARDLFFSLFDPRNLEPGLISESLGRSALFPLFRALHKSFSNVHV